MGTYDKHQTTFGDWEIDTIAGNLTYKGYYEIGFDVIMDQDWILHLSKKNWINFNDFIPAYFKVLSILKISELTIKINYDG